MMTDYGLDLDATCPSHIRSVSHYCWDVWLFTEFSCLRSAVSTRPIGFSHISRNRLARAFENFVESAKEGIVDEPLNQGTPLFGEACMNQWGSYCIVFISLPLI